jgi:hypothetical protein
MVLLLQINSSATMWHIPIYPHHWACEMSSPVAPTDSTTRSRSCNAEEDVHRPTSGLRDGDDGDDNDGGVGRSSYVAAVRRSSSKRTAKHVN